MPFVTDDTWSPARYRIALAAWQRNAPAKDSEVQPRRATKTQTPRHAHLAKKLRSLLTWRAATAGSDWTVIAANDNRSDGKPELIDSTYEIRPRLSEIFKAIEDVEFVERQHARLSGGGELDIVAVGGDIERGNVWPGSLRPRRKAPTAIVRLGSLEISNGGKEEPGLVLVAGRAVPGSVRIPLSGLVRISGHRVRDRFGKPKGANDNEQPISVGSSQSKSAGALEFCDPLADAQEASRIRRSVKPATATLLDFALRASNFREIGQHLGCAGKHAERRGKAALIEACEELEAALTA